jgi:anti-sigma B factor antagonist
MRMTFDITTAPDGLVRFAIAGELDTSSASVLRKEIDALLEKSPRRVEVDLSGLKTIDSSGVGVIVSLYKRVRAQGGEVLITGLQDQPLAIFKLLKLDRALKG